MLFVLKIGMWKYAVSDSVGFSKPFLAYDTADHKAGLTIVYTREKD